MLFGERLKTLREAAGLSQASLARESGVSVGSVRGYEQGRGLPSFVNAVALAAALGVSCESFRGCKDVIAERRAAGQPAKPAGKKGK